MDCGTSMVKYILFVFNSLCSIFGILIIIYGWLTLSSLPHIEINGHNAYGPEAMLPVFTIAIGSVILFVSFIGCCGAIRESYCMSMMYATFLLLLLIIQLMIVVALWSNKEQFLKGVGEVVDKAWESERNQPGIMNAMQKAFHCCGKNGPQDYIVNFQLPPSSCCEHDDCTHPTNIYTSGCKGKFLDFWSGKGETVKNAGLTLIAIELIGFIFACTLANNIRNYKRRAAY